MQRFAPSITFSCICRRLSSFTRTSAADRPVASESRAFPSSNGASTEPSNRRSHPEQRAYQPVRLPSRVSMRTLFKRTEAIKSLLHFFNAIKQWDDAQTPLAIASLQVNLSHYTVSEVIRSCHDADIALFFFKWLLERDNYDLGKDVYTAMIYRLGKAGNFIDMEEVVALSLRNSKASPIMFASLMSAYRRVNDINGVVSAWQTMSEHGIQPTSSVFTVMIDTYGRMKMYVEAGDCFYQLLHSNVGPTVKTCAALIYHLVEAGKLDAACEIFNNLTKIKVRANSVTYTYLMMGYVKAGDINTVLRLIREFQEYGHSTYGLGQSFKSVLQYLVKEGKQHDATRVMEVGWPDASSDEIQAKIAEISKETSDDGVSLGKESEAGSQTTDEDSDKEECGKGMSLTFIRTSGRDADLTSNVFAFVKCLHEWNSGTVKALEEANVQWDCQLVSEVLDRLKWVTPAWKFYMWVAKEPGYSHDKYTCAKMIRKLLRSGEFAHAWRLWRQAAEANMILPGKSYLNLLKHCGQQKQAKFAIEVFEKVKISGLVADESFYKCYIRTLYNCGRYWRLATVCAEMRKAGFPLDQTEYCFLISGFLRVGKLGIAKKLSNQMRAAGFHPNAFMLSDILKIFHSSGNFEKAERVFRGMQECGMHPSIDLCKIMTEILSALGKSNEADKLRKEIIILFRGQTKSKLFRQEVLTHFHSVFVNSFKDDQKEQVMVAAG